MASSNSARRIIKLDDVRQNNIVVVDLNENLSGNVFEKEYKKAAKIIGSIIDASKKKTHWDDPRCRSCKAGSCSTCKHRDLRGCQGSDIRKYSLTEFQTAVPFIGDRGTGKSSVMCSVLESLRCYRGENKTAALYLGDKHDNVRFVAFDMIDANTLKSRENIMEIILSRMLSYLEDLQPEGDFRELYRMIHELHEDLGLVYWKDSNKREGYGLTALQRVADSQKTITSFQKLVGLFTQEVSAIQFGGCPCYLVIALDDIDMYQGSNGGMNDSQFALLEHIYTHMRIPGLIVLMTYNEHILKRKCNDHFSGIYNGNRMPKDRSQTRRENIVALTAQFMSKLFPQERRIYLPNYMLVSLENYSNLFVQPTLDGDSLIAEELTRIFPPNKTQESVELPVKEFMLRLIAHKTGVYFDIAGTKKHFLEPRNLRELGELFQVICSMSIVPAEGKYQEVIREQNRQDLLEYLYNQFALRHLSSDEYRRFTRLAVLPLDRQGRTMVDQIRDHRRSLDLSKEHIAYLDKTRRDRWKYSYGELLHNIYFSTRMPGIPNSDQTFFSKEFIHCILGTHSVILNQNTKKNTDGVDGQSRDADETTDPSKLIRSVMGSSIAGRWANEMLPDFIFGGRKEGLGAGSLSIPIRYFFHWEIPVEVQDSMLSLHKITNIEEEDGKSAKALIQYLQAIACMGMFFTGFPNNGLKIKMNFGIDANGSPTICLKSESVDHICFNVMNFVINLYDVDEERRGYLPFIRKKLLKLGQEFFGQFTRNWEDERIQAENNRYERATALIPKYNPHQITRETIIEQNDDTQIQQYTQQMQEAEVWLRATYGYEFNEKQFMLIWEKITEDICEKLRTEINVWHRTYPHFPMVLPVQHFDMMYNIIKRLANIYYHDIPEEASIDEVYDYFVHLYESVVEELEQQDKYYHTEASGSFAQAFRDSAFFKIFNAPESVRNPYIKPLLVAMMRNALSGYYQRYDHAIIL